MNIARKISSLSWFLTLLLLSAVNSSAVGQTAIPTKDLAKLMGELIPNDVPNETWSKVLGPHFQSLDVVSKALPGLKRLPDEPKFMISATTKSNLGYFARIRITLNSKQALSGVVEDESYWNIVVSGPSAAATTFEFIPTSSLAKTVDSSIERYLISQGFTLSPILCFNVGGSGGNYEAFYYMKIRNKVPARLLVKSGVGSMGNSVKFSIFLADIDKNDLPGYGVKREEWDIAPGLGLCNIKF